jgi:hypothetical protein
MEGVSWRGKAEHAKVSVHPISKVKQRATEMLTAGCRKIHAIVILATNATSLTTMISPCSLVTAT